MIENSWSVSNRHLWDLTNHAHRYFVEPLGGTHARRMLVSRYVSFVQSVKKSPKLTVQLLLQMSKDNLETVTGRNIRYILTELNQEDIFKIKKSYIKKNLKFAPAAEEDDWKIEFVKEITNVKQNVLHVEGNDHGQFTTEELDELVNYLTTV